MINRTTKDKKTIKLKPMKPSEQASPPKKPDKTSIPLNAFKTSTHNTEGDAQPVASSDLQSVPGAKTQTSQEAAKEPLKEELGETEKEVQEPSIIFTIAACFALLAIASDNDKSIYEEDLKRGK